MDELSLAIAGLRATVVTQHRDILDVVRDRYKGFLSPGAADWRIETNFVASQAVTAFTNPIGNSAQKFYRIVGN